jgi:CHRD domain
MIKRHRMKILGAAACASVLAAAVIVALPASGTAPAGSAFFAKLDGEHEPSGGDPDGYGTFSGLFNGTTLCYGLQVAKIGTPQAAHIHEGAIGVNGSIRITLNKPASGGADASKGCISLADRTALVSRIKQNPRNFYVNVHTSTFSGGAVRGQLFQANATQDK